MVGFLLEFICPKHPAERSAVLPLLSVPTKAIAVSMPTADTAGIAGRQVKPQQSVAMGRRGEN